MATIVDALLVTLGLDTKEYEKGTKKAEKELATFDKKRADSDKRDEDTKRKAAKEQEQRFKRQQQQDKAVGDALGHIRNQLVAIGGLFLAGQGLIAFAKSSIDTAANVGRLSENTSMAVEELAGLEQAFKRTGGSAEEAQSTIGMLAKNLSNMTMGMESNVAEYTRWGGDIGHGQLKNAKSYLLGIADLLHRINKENPSKAWMVAGRLGLTDTGFNLAKQGSKAVEAQMAAGAKMAGITKKQADAAREAQKSWADITSLLTSVIRVPLLDVLKEISKWMQRHQKDIQGWLVSFRDFMDKMTPKAIDGLVQKFKDIADAIKTIAESLKKLRPLMDGLGLTTPEGVQKPGLLHRGASEIWKHRDWMNPAGMIGNAAKMIYGEGQKLLGGDTNVNINQMTITTHATDARGVAAGMHDAIRQQGFSAQANAQ